jgi:single-strand DNA-binding protein
MLIGHLGDVVKLHYFEGGNCVGRFPIATNETYTNRQTGEKVTNTEWHNIVVRNKAAEVCEKYLSKGDLIYVEGRLKTRQWQGEDGVTRYSTEVQATDFTFLSNKQAEGNPEPGHGTGQKAPLPASDQNSGSTNPQAGVPEEDDLPF